MLLKSLHICLLMLIKYTHQVPDRRHASQISPGFCEEKTHYESLFSVILHSCFPLGTHRRSQCKQTQKSMMDLNLEKFIPNSKIVLLCTWQWMEINCAGSTQDLTTTKADEVGSGYLRMIYPTSMTLSFLYEGPWSIWKPLSSLKKYNYSLCCGSITSGALFWQAWRLIARRASILSVLVITFPHTMQTQLTDSWRSD